MLIAPSDVLSFVFQVLQSVMEQQGGDVLPEGATPGSHSTVVSLVFSGGNVAHQMDRIATSAEEVTPTFLDCCLKLEIHPCAQIMEQRYLVCTTVSQQ